MRFKYPASREFGLRATDLYIKFRQRNLGDNLLKVVLTVVSQVKMKFRAKMIDVGCLNHFTRKLSVTVKFNVYRKLTC